MLSRTTRRALFPVFERSFTYAAYERLLDALSDAERVTVVPLRTFTATRTADRAVVALRHDVDYRLDSALEMGRREHDRGLRATYFVLHTAQYWKRDDLIPALLELQGMGHEIGWHNDLVTLECIFGGDARAFLADELQRLRSAGITIDGIASHGSPFCYRFGYHNNAFFEDFDGEEFEGFPNSDSISVRGCRRAIPKGRLADFALSYEAYHLDNDLYFSDAAFGARGRRWHTDQLDVNRLTPGSRGIILVHPCHWDRSIFGKIRRLPAAFARVADSRKPAGASE